MLVSCLLWAALLSAAGIGAPGSASQEIVDRTLALVGGQAITQSDVRAAIALGLVEITKPADPVPDVTSQLVDRELVLREVQRYAPPTPTEAAVDSQLDDIRKRFAAPGALDRVLDLHGFTETRLRAWVRDDLRAQAYLAQRFASASTPTDAEIAAAYTQQKAVLDQAGLTFEQASPMIRDRLSASRRRELITDWVSDLRRRTDVIILQ
jgi:parvulin-like peptidyl-prolyl isomerase